MKHRGSLTRRRFLLLGLGAGAAAIYAVHRWHWGDPSEVVVAILKRRVGYLNVEPDTFKDFAVRYLHHRRTFRSQISRLAAVASLLRFASPYRWLRLLHPLRRLEDNVVGLYLLSTDFFHNGADERRPVRYVAFYDPYSAPCRNPFARRP